jgi:endo-1,4-beta-mannosidase
VAINVEGYGVTCLPSGLQDTGPVTAIYVNNQLVWCAGMPSYFRNLKPGDVVSYGYGVTTGDTRVPSEVIADLRGVLQQQWDTNAVLRGTIGRLEDTIEALLGYTECGCGEDEEGHYGQCVPCQIRDES